MKTIYFLPVLAVALAAADSEALTVTPSEVAGRIREVTLSAVRFEGQPRLVLADAKGISLYTFDLDTEGKSACRSRCLEAWPPMSVAADAEILPPFGKITGNDGRPQLTLKGLPLYYFRNDKVPGDTMGHYPDWQLVFVEE